MDSKPKIQLLKQKRSFLQYILLSVVTCSLYHYWFMDSLVKDVNVICKKDGQDTVGVGRMIGFSILTFGVYQYLWLAEIVDRVYDSADEYVLSDTIDQLTTDHTVVQREITEGRLTAQQAAKDPRQSLLLQCVGAGKVVKPDYLYGDIKPHQV